MKNWFYRTYCIIRLKLTFVICMYIAVHSKTDLLQCEMLFINGQDDASITTYVVMKRCHMQAHYCMSLYGCYAYLLKSGLAGYMIFTSMLLECTDCPRSQYSRVSEYCIVLLLVWGEKVLSILAHSTCLFQLNHVIGSILHHKNSQFTVTLDIVLAQIFDLLTQIYSRECPLQSSYVFYYKQTFLSNHLINNIILCSVFIIKLSAICSF